MDILKSGEDLLHKVDQLMYLLKVSLPEKEKPNYWVGLSKALNSWAEQYGLDQDPDVFLSLPTKTNKMD